MQALERANTVRLGRVEVKRAIDRGHMTIAQALEHPAAQGMTVGGLLCAQYRWGPHKARRTLRSLERCSPPIMVSGTRLVRDLTVREREALIRACGPAREVLAETWEESHGRAG
jgi:hypothetical protein